METKLNEVSKSYSNGLLEPLYIYLNGSFPKMHGTGFMLTTDNLFDSLLQTPNVWGKSANEVPQNKGIYVANEIEDIISSAKEFIDITTLVPFPDGDFFNAIQAGLERISNNGHSITVRILCGWYPQFTTGVDEVQYLKQLIEPFRNSATNLSIYVAAQRTELITGTWNHSKIVAVDGKTAILGGENLWDANYLGPYPVHDLNLRVSGSSVYFMHKFIDEIWKNVCSYNNESWKSVHWSCSTGITKRCLSSSLNNPSSGNGTMSILGAGRYGTEESKVNPADEAMLWCFNVAKESIYISQQDLGNTGFYWEKGMEAIARAILRGVNVKIVISNDFGKASATRDPHSSSSDPYHTSTQEGTYLKILEYLYLLVDDSFSKQQVHQLISEKFELAVLRFGPSDKWPNDWEFANHAKFFMIDEKVFYIGSENLYPANLIEYGVFIDESYAVTYVKTRYWQQLWQYSSRTAKVFENS